MDTGPVVSAADPPSVAEDPPAGERAQTIAQYQAALAAAQESVRRARAALATAGELQDSLEPMPVIEQAKGIVMAQQRCGPDEAFDLLRRASQRKNVKVSVLAAQIVAQVASPPAEARVQPISAHRDRARSSGALNSSGEPRGRIRSGWR